MSWAFIHVYPQVTSRRTRGFSHRWRRLGLAGCPWAIVIIVVVVVIVAHLLRVPVISSPVVVAFVVVLERPALAALRRCCWGLAVFRRRFRLAALATLRVLPRFHTLPAPLDLFFERLAVEFLELALFLLRLQIHGRRARSATCGILRPAVLGGDGRGYCGRGIEVGIFRGLLLPAPLFTLPIPVCANEPRRTKKMAGSKGRDA